jgi:hypothetical protein
MVANIMKARLQDPSIMAYYPHVTSLNFPNFGKSKITIQVLVIVCLDCKFTRN